MRRELTPSEQLIVEWFRLQLQKTRERDAHEFAMELANARLEAARRRLDFWQEMLTEMQLITASLAEDTAKWRFLRSDAREASEAKKIAEFMQIVVEGVADIK
jgi:hypothetical protein